MFTERSKKTKDRYLDTFDKILNKLNELYEMLFKKHMLSADEEYQILSLKNPGTKNIGGTSIYILNLPAGNYYLRFGEDNDFINSKYLRRGDNFYLKFDEIELKGNPSIENVVLYIGK